MPPLQSVQGGSGSPQGSATPLVPGQTPTTGERDPKTGKRRFFGLGKKKEVQQEMMTDDNKMPRSSSPAKGAPDLKPQAQPLPVSPSRHPYQGAMAASPSRIRSSSPRLNSPASSEIFERNVQEPAQIATLQGENTPAHLPAHVITEDHIPPALEASAQAITSDELNPDEVEIVMSAAHQPAASAIDGSSSHADLTQLQSQSPLAPLQQVKSEESEPTSLLQSSMLPPGAAADDDGASNYGQLDPNDVRRLSFISFADVVQSENQQPPGPSLSDAGNRDSLHIASLPGSFKQERAASPLRSPRSPISTHSHSGGGVTTPPPGVNVPTEQSPGRSIGSPHGELTIETMRQAVRKTASGDLSGGRSVGMSPVSDENLPSAPRSRTNS